MSSRVNPIRPLGGGGPVGGGGGGRGGTRTDLNLRERLCYLNNAFEISPLLLTFLENMIPQKWLVKGTFCSHGNLIFNAMFSKIVVFSFN